MNLRELGRNRSVFLTCIGVVLLWFVIYESSRRLPYLYTSFAFNIRAFVIFPVLTTLISWFLFIRKWREGGKTGYQMAMEKLEKRRERIKQTLLSLVGLILVSSTLAWTSIAFSVWATALIASAPFAQRYRVGDIRAVSSFYDVSLTGLSGNQEVALRLTPERMQQRNWATGEIVCVCGRSSIFGTIVESIGNDVLCKCRARGDGPQTLRSS